MSGNFFWQSQASPRLLLKWTRRICHIQPATAVADRKTVTEHVLAKLYSQLGIERLHESVAKDIAGDDVRMPRTENQITIGMDPRPVKRHEATLVAKCVQIVGEIGFVILTTQLAWGGNDKGW